MPLNPREPKAIIPFLSAPTATALLAERIAARAAPRLLAADSRLRQAMFRNAEPEDLPYVRLSCKLLEPGPESKKLKGKRDFDGMV